MNPTIVLAALALLVFVGLALEELFRRTGIPDVLVLLGIGILAGSTGLVDIQALGGIDKVFTTSALVLILFEGAVRLRLPDLRSALAGTMRITLLGFFVAVLVVAAVAVIFMGMRPLAGLLLGAIVGGTSSAVVIPMVQSLGLGKDTRTALALESALTDVIGIVITLALVGALAAGTVEMGAIGLQLGAGFAGGVAIGVAMGLLWAFGLRSLRQHRVSFVALGAAVFLVYAVAEAAGTFGAIACLAFGVTLGNASAIVRKAGKVEGMDLAPGERLFLAEVAFLLKVFFFVYLGASLKLGSWQPWLFGLLAAAAIFVSRPVAVRFGLPRATTSRRDALVASALVPRGLAAGVLASIPVQMGIAEGAVIEAAAVGTILFTITVSSGLVFAIETPFVRGMYERFFRSYPETIDAEAVVVVPLHDGPEVEGAPAALPDHDGVDASADAMTAYAMSAGASEDPEEPAPAPADRKESA